MMDKLFTSISGKTGLFCLLFAVLYGLSYNYNKDRLGAIIYSDMEGYYVYLPGSIIYPGFKNIPVRTKEHFTVDSSTGKLFTKYTYGVALLESPFFFIAHVKQLLSDKSEATGYSHTYDKSIMAAGIFYSLAGLFLLFYALRRNFSLLISVAALLAVFLGSNLYYYTICQPGMSHVYSFCLFAFIIYLTPSFLKSSDFKKWLVYGFVFGLIILIRPTNSILLLYPLLYGCYSVASFGSRISFFLNNPKNILIAALAAGMVFLPQLIYWKYISGNFLLYSYHQESFENWKNPKILKVLFDVQNGWLLYSPVMLLAILGLFINLKKRAAGALPAIIILSIATYLFASWWLWWFGGAFGHRCYVEFYPILSFGLAGFLVWSTRNKYATPFMALVIFACVFYNLKLTYIYGGGWEGPSWTWQNFAWILKHAL